MLLPGLWEESSYGHSEAVCRPLSFLVETPDCVSSLHAKLHHRQDGLALVASPLPVATKPSGPNGVQALCPALFMALCTMTIQGPYSAHASTDRPSIQPAYPDIRGRVAGRSACLRVQLFEHSYLTNGLVLAGFVDPFPVSAYTLDNPDYKPFGISLMTGKLDWLMVRGVKVVDKATGNHDYKASDHKWLSADIAW